MSETPVEGDGMIDAEALAAAGAAAVAACLACGSKVSGPFCAVCGQRNDDLRRSVFRLIRDFIEDTFAFDSRMWRTLGALAFAPGRAPRDYAHGMRSRYTPPVRLFLWVSFLFFLTLSLTNIMFLAVEVTNRAPTPERSGAALSISSNDLEDSGAAKVDCDLSVSLEFFVRAEEVAIDEAAWRRCTTTISDEARASIEGDGVETEEQRAEAAEALDLVARAIKGIERVVTDPAGFNEEINDWLPRVLFFMTPLLALFIAIFIRGKDAMLFDHGVFAIYAHAVGFVIVGVAIVASQFGATLALPIATLALFAYLLLGLKRAYGRGWIKTTLATVVVSLLYSMALFSISLAIVSNRIWSAGA
jgi:hypothetical protein